MNRPNQSASRATVITAAIALFCLALPFAAQVDAQAARRPVRARGNVTGVELSLVGALSAPRGGSLRWALTAYDVVGLSDLRPSSRAQVRVDTSLDTDDSAIDVVTDERGRVVVEIPIPADTEGSQMGAVVTVRSRAGASRRFELSVALDPRRGLSLNVAPRSVMPGEKLNAFGRVYENATNHAVPNAALMVQFNDSRGPLGAPVQLTTDAAGVYHVEWTVPLDAAGNVSARVIHEVTEDQTIRAERAVVIAHPVAPNMVVLVRPENEIVQPRANVYVDVEVRRGDGRPVHNAMIPWREGNQNREIYTNAQGRARLRYVAPRLARGFRDVGIQVTAEREGIGSARGSAQLRVAASDHAAGLSVDGGALSIELGGTIYVRVVGRDGRAAANTTAVIEGPRIARAEARTDADGVAAFEVSLKRAAPEGEDSCGGEVATSVSVSVGTGPRAANNARCVAIDPELNTRVSVADRSPRAGEQFAVTVTRGRSARGRAVVVTLLQKHANQMRVVGSQVLGPRETVGELAIPSDASGFLLLRARPIVQHGQELRGSVTALYATRGPALRLASTLDARGQHRATVEGDRASILAIAMSAEDARHYRDNAVSEIPFGLRVPMDEAGDLLLAGALAAHTPRDLHASAVLRGRELVAVPAPQNPVQVGLLRDPWRAQARFVEGRMGLLFRAVEERVKSALPNRLEDVAFERGGRLRFNRQILAGIAPSALGGEGATSLGGEPLSIEQLERLDPAFNFDNTARRITRERLFSLLLALRNFVQSQALDLPWARPGEPALWLEKLIGQHVPNAGVSIQASHLVDGWGRAFRLIPTRSPRFSALAPVAGYELVSSGPDGRYGNRDDLVDPTARVLPSGSLYGQAVGEDSLVARLSGVELGRVTIGFAGRTFSIGSPRIAAPSENSVNTNALAAWQQLPPVFQPVRARFFRVTRRPVAQSVWDRSPDAEEAMTTTFAFDPEPRDWGVLTRAYSARGVVAQDMVETRGGVPVLVDAIVPDRMTLGRPLQTYLHVTSLADPGGSDLRFGVRVESEHASIEHPAEITLPAGDTLAVPLTLRGTTTGRARLGVTLDGDPPLATSAHVLVDRAHHPIRRRAVELVEAGSRRFALTIPSDAVDPSSRVVLLAPTFLAADPDFADVRRSQPALIAWSYARAGLPIDPALRSGLLRAQNAGQSFASLSVTDMPLLRAACRAQAFAWIADDESTPAQRRALNELQRSSTIEDLAAATLVMRPMEEPPAHQERHMASARVSLRRVLRDYPAEPSLMARAAAALLWADPRDGHGLAMLDRVSEGRERFGAGEVIAPSEEREAPLERFIATAALAIAADLADRPALATSLAKGAMSIAPLAARAGGESTFWLLALGAHGTLGTGTSSVRVTIDGEAQDVDLSNGAASIPITGTGRHAITVATEGSVVARVESVFARPLTTRTDGPFSLETLGDSGRYRGPSGLVLRLKASARVRDGLIDLLVPAGAVIDERTEALLAQNAVVHSVERRAPGFLRMRLQEVLEGQQHDIALPFHWHAFGPVDGLAAIAYAASEPGAMTVLSGESITIAEELQ